MRTKLSMLDVRILQALGEKTPRNLTEVARNLGVPTRTVNFRIKRMYSKAYLRLHASIFYSNLGIKQAAVFGEAFPGLEGLFFECLKVNDYWRYVNRCYGNRENCFAVYAIPVEYSTKFEEFLCEIVKLRVAKNIRFFWTTNFQYSYVNSMWFDSEKCDWIFRWSDWISEIRHQSPQLPQTLISSKNYDNCVDKIDVLILKELEKDATAPLNKIAKELDISPQLAHYHHEEHILKKNLLAGF